MVNTSVFRGSDGVIEFALAETTPETKKQKKSATRIHFLR